MTPYIIAMVALIGSGGWFGWRCMESRDYLTLVVGVFYALSAYAAAQLG